jgi:EAL domain-containing protein (putative c-di-GMP-specific phosphodiesterase class I)
MDFMVFRKAISESLMGGRESLLFMNLSQRSAIVPDFMTRLKNLLKETGYHAENIVFEISEGETIRNMGILVGIMKEVRSMGIRFAIDDFGSGRMLQNCMRELPIDFLKIDGSFVQGTGKGVLMDGALVKSFVTFAKSTGVVTIAENIENEKTRRILMENGVDWGQGYHIGIPECSLKDPGG